MCKNCKFFKEPVHGTLEGACIRNPPVVVAGKFYGQYPTIKENHTPCGEYKNNRE
jgi:hypothetical protein